VEARGLSLVKALSPGSTWSATFAGHFVEFRPLFDEVTGKVKTKWTMALLGQALVIYLGADLGGYCGAEFGAP